MIGRATTAVLLVAGLLAGCQSSGTGGATVAAVTAPAATATQAATFVPLAVSANAFEIQSSQLAAERTRDPAVRRFARQMIADHRAADRRMTTVLRRAGMAVGAPTLAPHHAEMLTALSAAPAAGFDQAYLEAQRTAHQESVTLFQAYAAGGDDPTLVRFAAETLPTLERHLAEVQAMPVAGM